MRKIIVSIHLKDIIVALGAVLGFVMLLTFILIGGSAKEIESEKLKNYNFNDEVIFEDEVAQKNLFNNYVINPKVKIYLTKQGKVNEMNLEEYIIGVVAAEMPAEFEEEALKAQAIAARTYAIAHMESIGGNKCSKGRGADLCDSVHCQAYISKDERMQLWPKSKAKLYWNKIVNAVEETGGEIITYNGQVVMSPYYFATSSGKTENASEVFSRAEPYLKSVSSPGEERAPKYKTSFKYKYRELANIIIKKYPDAKINSMNIKKNIQILSRSEGGSVKDIRIGEKNISGMNFRMMLGLTSANFEIEFNSNDVEVRCNGYGHGVGMSQWGADAMAKEGKKYIDILQHYYQGVEISKINYK